MDAIDEQDGLDGLDDGPVPGTIRGGPSGSGRAGGGTAVGRSRVPSRSPTERRAVTREPREPKPEWLEKFEKECLNHFKVTKRSVELCLTQAKEVVTLCTQNPEKMKGNHGLPEAYLKTIKCQISILEAHDIQAASLALNRVTVPANAAAADKVGEEWKLSAKDLKLHKQNFLTACQKMQHDLRTILAGK